MYFVLFEYKAIVFKMLILYIIHCVQVVLPNFYKHIIFNKFPRVQTLPEHIFFYLCEN